MIKQRQSAAAPAAPGATWGVVAETTPRHACVRFELKDRSISLPYSALLRWEWQAGDPESFTIVGRKETLVIQGRELGVIRDALDSGKLQLVREQDARHAVVASGTWVTTIKLETA